MRGRKCGGVSGEQEVKSSGNNNRSCCSSCSVLMAGTLLTLYYLTGLRKATMW